MTGELASMLTGCKTSEDLLIGMNTVLKSAKLSSQEPLPGKNAQRV
jgi:carbonic anhydrase/acetyltransferase-like protein (isoleucine patch superfamily)